MIGLGINDMLISDMLSGNESLLSSAVADCTAHFNTSLQTRSQIQARNTCMHQQPFTYDLTTPPPPPVVSLVSIEMTVIG